MQENPNLFIFQGTQKDRKRQKLQLRYQFLLYYKRTKNRTAKKSNTATTKMEYLFRQFFNFWTDAGNPAKVIKRRFRNKLRAYNTPVVVLVKHITWNALKITRFRNKSILHNITSIY